MNEVDIEIQRLNARVTTTWFVFMFGVMGLLYIVYELARVYWFENAHLIFISALAVLIAKYFEPKIRSFYEKRLMNSKKRNHTL